MDISNNVILKWKWIFVINIVDETGNIISLSLCLSVSMIVQTPSPPPQSSQGGGVRCKRDPCMAELKIFLPCQAGRSMGATL